MSQVANHLMALLAEDGISAQLVWQAQQPFLGVLLGHRAELFSHAVEGFDFPNAQHILRNAIQSNSQRLVVNG